MALSAGFVNSAARGNAPAGKHFDDGGLFLTIAPSGRASWVFRYERGGVRRELGLGGLASLGLADAREVAAEHRRSLAKGIEPVSARRAAAVAVRTGKTWDEAVSEFLDAYQGGWKNAKHKQQWRNTLDTYASPVIGTLGVAKITTDDVHKIIAPIWSTKAETASRLRGRIERVLDWAKTRGLRDGENPARWRGHFSLLLPPKSRVHTVRHHAAAPVDGLPAIYASLCDSEGTAALAVRLCLLTAARPGEVAGATWPEVDEAARLWTVPSERMKRGREQRVPLSDESLAVLELAKRRRCSESIFPGAKRTRGRDTQLSLASLSKALRTAGGADATVHGTSRSTFDDWATARGVPAPIIDRALAHASGNMTVQAYRRADLLEQRRPVMADWAKHLTSER
jgi:integrase